MADETIDDLEPIGEGEFSEETPLSAEELFEQHKAEIDAAFEVKGFFRRMKEMFAGLSKPHSSPEFKLARIELQRLAAPILAILLPALGFLALIIITAVTGQVKQTIQVDIAHAQEQEEDLKEEEEQVEPDETPPDEMVDVTVDTPNVTVTDATPSPTPQNEPVTVKPATQDSVALIKSPVTMKSMAGSRNPGSIGLMTRGGAGYGDRATEEAVMKALRWLKKNQAPNGSINIGLPLATLSNTSLAILAFLAHGETPASKEFGQTVEKALDFIISSHYVDKEGVSRFRHTDGNEYAFLIATYALCEAYGMTRNPNTKQVAMQTLQRIVDNQSPTGGWDYKINKKSTRDDMSFAGWALQALKAGKMAGMHPKGLDECIKKAIKCLKTRNFRSGGFNYTAGGGPNGLTATGCLAMQLLGYMNEKEVKEALDTMRAWLPSFNPPPKGKKLSEALPGANPQYYCYYASQCKYQAGMCQGATKANIKAWQEWNLAMKALYPKTINTLPETIPGPDGKPKKIGYWTFKDATCKAGGDSMATCLCALQLMVYYRYLPTTQTKAAKAITTGEEEKEKKKAADVEVEVDI